MKILVFTEHDNGNLKKSSKEVISYAKDLATPGNLHVVAVTINNNNINSADFGNCGADTVISLKGDNLNTFSTEAYSIALAQTIIDENASYILFSNTYTGKSISSRIAVKIKAGMISGVVSLPENGVFKRAAFSNKAYSFVKLNSEKKVITLTPNSYEIKNFGGNASVTEKTINVDSTQIHTKTLNISKVEGKIPLTEAELVVSGGRGMKGPENWHLIEEFASTIGAATACSKPVADMDWRPHAEHVGQTGLTIKANLYIAIGISGAIQHLAGVSSSKVICVINKDPEAPFFKAADYGIVGDAFEILPKLIERAKQLKN
ncbi:MAG: electron transfer flavoprotein subunit alpha/FixB family protein [Bacteroidetes bacterium]|nr:electron transfer flavoprotein subunit alpha/FixB family protein [Bacteroidota bacterium]